MEFENEVSTAYAPEVNSDLDTLACLATSAGRMHNNEQTHDTVIHSTKDDQTQSQNYPDSFLTIPTSCESRVSVQKMIPSPSQQKENTKVVDNPPKSVEEDCLGDMKGYQFKSVAIKELVESYVNNVIPPLSSPNSARKSMYLTENACLMNLSHINSTAINTLEMYQNFSSEPNKSAFNVVSPRGSSEMISPVSNISSTNGSNNGFQKVVVCNSGDAVPQQPPSLFGLDPPSSTNGGSLFETLVQESHKILIKQEKEGNTLADIKKTENFAAANYKNLPDSSRTHTNFVNMGHPSEIIKNGEVDHIVPQKKFVKKRRIKSNVVIHNSSEVKRAHGGPPFNPGSSPPPPNTAESALCTLHEHTLLKMATRGFWSGDRGPLQDVFRLTRVENSDLQYKMDEITEHCYNVVKHKLEGAISEKEVMHRHMRSYVDEIDSYLERIYPVSSVAINIYLPTAADYAIATWHGIVPTGWSEYRRAVVIREVFEILYYFSTIRPTIPEYNSSFFDKDIPDTTLYPMTIVTEDSKSHRVGGGNSSGEGVDSILGKDASHLKYSRAFEALWTRTVPHEPFLILDDTLQLKLREYLEQFPIECYAPPESAIVVVDNKKYKAREILGYFRRGVQLVDYPKEMGRMIIDTVSTLKNFSMTGAVRKIPPGKISKLVHSDLHLENYTNAILQIGVIGSDLGPNQTVERTKIRKRRLKSHTGNNQCKNETKNKKETHQNVKEEDPSTIKLEGIASFCGTFDKKLVGHLNFPYDDSATITRPFDLNLNKSPNILSPQTNEQSYYEEKNIKGMNNNVDSMEHETKVKDTEESFDFPPPVHRPKPEIPSNLYTPDILSSMFFPPGTSGEMFSLHLMIDSYRRAAKYLLDTANHLELVARRGGSGGYSKREPEDPGS